MASSEATAPSNSDTRSELANNDGAEPSSLHGAGAGAGAGVGAGAGAGAWVSGETPGERMMNLSKTHPNIALEASTVVQRGAYDASHYYYSLRDAGHFMMVDQAEEVNTLIEAFFERLRLAS